MNSLILWVCIISMTRLWEIPRWSLLQGIANPFCPPALRGISHLHWRFAGRLSLFPFVHLSFWEFCRAAVGKVAELTQLFLLFVLMAIWATCDASSLRHVEPYGRGALPVTVRPVLYPPCVCVRACVIGCFSPKCFTHLLSSLWTRHQDIIAFALWWACQFIMLIW